MVKAEELLANPWEPDISARRYTNPVFWAPMLRGSLKKSMWLSHGPVKTLIRRRCFAQDIRCGLRLFLIPSHGP